MALPGKLQDDFNPTRRSLLIRLKDWNDQESWRCFFDAYWKLVYSVALKAGLTATEAEEVVQETFIAVAKNIREFEYDRSVGLFRNWLIKTTRWRIADQLRKRKNHHQAPPPRATRTARRTATIDRVPDPHSQEFEKLCEEEWKHNLVRRAVDKVKTRVSAKHFQVFDLRVIKDMPAAEVADLMGVSTTFVYVTNHRIRKLVDKEVAILKDKNI